MSSTKCSYCDNSAKAGITFCGRLMCYARWFHIDGGNAMHTDSSRSSRSSRYEDLLFKLVI
jgi:hypothetical protein